MIGYCNSGHDIARDCYHHAYDVTIVKRSNTLVLTSGTLIHVTMTGLYVEDGVIIPTPNVKKHADLFSPLASPPLKTQTYSICPFPTPLLNALNSSHKGKDDA